jgi:hypothetical protein
MIAGFVVEFIMELIRPDVHINVWFVGEISEMDHMEYLCYRHSTSNLSQGCCKPKLCKGSDLILGIVGHAADKFTPLTGYQARLAIRYRPSKVISGGCHLGGMADYWYDKLP